MPGRRSPGLVLNGAYIYNETEFKEFEQANCWVAAPFQTGTPDPGRRNPGDAFCDRSGDRTQANPEHTVLLFRNRHPFIQRYDQRLHSC